MSFDLTVLTVRDAELAELATHLREANVDLPEGLESLAGIGALRLRVGPDTVEAGPGVSRGAVDPSVRDERGAPARLRKLLARTTVAYHLTGHADAAGHAAQWLLAGALADVAEGVVYDPQDGVYFTAAAARARGKKLLARLSPGRGDSAEARLVDRLTRDGASPARIHNEVEALRSARLLKSITKEYAALLSDPNALAAHLRDHPPSSDAHVSYLFEKIWDARNHQAARAAVGATPAAMLQRHLLEAVRAVGLSARLYLEFLAAAGAFERAVDRAALEAAASGSDMREVISAPDRSGQ